MTDAAVDRIESPDADRLRTPETPDEAHRPSPLAWLLLQLVALYRASAPFRSPRCRFHPSCSTYAVVALQRHGAFRGSWLAMRRLGRCHPWNPGGVDHVPPRK
jgi:uncharacterized protein